MPVRLGVCFALALLPVCAAAQPAMENAARASWHLGPLSLDPRLVIDHVGVDTNVFNQASEPVQDFTATAGPELDSWIRIGRLSWAGTTAASWTYFRTVASERSFNMGQSGRLELDLQHVVPFAQGFIERGRQRPNLEIDARVRRETTIASGGLDILAGARTTVTLAYGTRQFEYDDASLQGTSLAWLLDRDEAIGTVGARHAVTPLTSLVVEAAVRRDRFRFSTERNSEGARATAGVEFRPLALVSGRAVVGVQRFEPDSDDVPDYTGVVSDVELAYQLRDWTRFVVLVERDLDYSFEALQAYYVSTGLRLSVVQALGGAWDVIGHVARTDLDYRPNALATPEEIGRLDRVTAWGVGFGRRFASGVRVGVDIEHARRESNLHYRTYEGWRGGGSFTYGF